MARKPEVTGNSAKETLRKSVWRVFSKKQGGGRRRGPMRAEKAEEAEEAEEAEVGGKLSEVGRFIQTKDE